MGRKRIIRSDYGIFSWIGRWYSGKLERLDSKYFQVHPTDKRFKDPGGLEISKHYVYVVPVEALRREMDKGMVRESLQAHTGTVPPPVDAIMSVWGAILDNFCPLEEKVS